MNGKLVFLAKIFRLLVIRKTLKMILVALEKYIILKI